MQRVRLAFTLASAIGIAGCDGSGELITPPPPPSPNGPECLLIMSAPVDLGPSGASCTTTSAYATATTSTTVNVTAGSGSLRGSITGGASLLMVPFTFAFTLTRSGHVAEGTYSNTTSGVVGNVTITNAGSASYMASAGAGNNVGTFTLVITKSTTLTNTANGTSYLIDGTLDATVPAVASSGATGTVTVHQTFRNN